MKVEASAPAKVILVGEHFVVENEPAIACAVELRAHVTVEDGYDDILLSSQNFGSSIKLSIKGDILDGRENLKIFEPLLRIDRILRRMTDFKGGYKLEVNSSIPPASGMGSSAAVAVATVAAVSKIMGLELDLEEISKIAYEAEKIVHGTPSGIDNTIATYGGIIVFRKSEGFIRLEADFSKVMLIVADSGLPRNTGKMVRKVKNLKNKYPRVFEPLYHTAGRLAIEAAQAIRDGRFHDLGELMNVNHGLLSAIGVSNRKLEEMVYTAREAGALGAKITGAGGGGSIVVLTTKEDSLRVSKALKKISRRVYVLNIAEKGVVVL